MKRLIAKVLPLAASVSLLSFIGVGSSPAHADSSWDTTNPNVFAVGTYNGQPGNVTCAEPHKVACIQQAVNEAELYAQNHLVNGVAPDTFVLLAPDDYKTDPAAIEPAPPGQTPAGVLIGCSDNGATSCASLVGGDNVGDNVWLVGMDRNHTIIDGTQSGPPCSTSATDQVYGPSGNSGEGLNGVMVYKAAGTWVQNVTVCNFLDGSAGDEGTGNEIWWNGGAGSAQLFTDGLGGYNGDYLTATSTYFNVKDGNNGENTAATYGIFSSDWAGTSTSKPGGTWDHTYASNFNDSGYYIGACQQQCFQTVDYAWSQHSALGYSGSNSGGTLLVENSRFDHNEDGFDTNSQNGDNPPPQDGSCPAGQSPSTFTEPDTGKTVTPPSCWVFFHNEVDHNNDPNVPTYGSAAAGPVGTGLSIAGGRDDTLLDNNFHDNGAWGAILVPYPDFGGPCTGGVGGQVAGQSVSLPGAPTLPPCWYDESGIAVMDNTFSNNGGFGNPTNGDIAATNALPGPTDCFSGNTDEGAPLAMATTSPPAAQQTYPICVIPGTNIRPIVPPDANAPFTAEVVCDSTLLVACPSVPLVNYPRQTNVALYPLPGATALDNPSSTSLPTMPLLCTSLEQGNMPTNPWCP